jgi:MFS family permease
MTRSQTKILSLTALGGALEFYDFTIYALFAPYLSQHFFAHTNQVVALLNTFAVFALGYLARPLGGIFFGHLGDKFGRKYAFSLAIFLMAMATLLIGCLPTYASIGIAAPFLLIGLRLLQGFSVGGEIPGATVFILEHIAAAQRGLAIGILFMCITLGNTLGALMGLLLTTLLSPDIMQQWGWRLPFIFGCLLGIISFIVRLRIMETPEFLTAVKQQKLYRAPLLELLKSARKTVTINFFMTAIMAANISFFLYLPTYLSSVLHLQISYTYLLNVVSFLIFSFMTAISGWLSDYVGRKQLMITGNLLILSLGYWLFAQLSVQDENFIWFFAIGYAILSGMVNGYYAVSLAESFPTNLRYSGTGLSYSLGIGIFGGLAPLSFTYLVDVFHNVIAPYYYLFGCAVLTLSALLFYKQNTSKYSSVTKAIKDLS